MKTLSFGFYIYFRSRGFMTYLSDAPVASHVRVQKVLGTYINKFVGVLAYNYKR